MAYTPNNPNGQATSANSSPVVIASDQVVNILDADAFATGTITATDTVAPAPQGAGAFVNGSSPAASLVALACPGGDSAWAVQITGLTSGTLYFEESLDSTTGIDGNWIAVNGRQTGVVNTVLGIFASANGMYRGNTSGVKYVRVRSAGILVGTPAIIIRISGGSGAIFLNASVPAGTNPIGSVGVVDANSNKALLTNRGEQLVNGANLDAITNLLAQLVLEAKRQSLILSSLANFSVDDSEISMDQLFN